MSEAGKTITFLVAGILALGTAYMVTSAPSDFDPADRVGQMLNEFAVDEPKSLKIVKVAPDGASLDEFEVAEQDDVWTIPSKQGYPADATEQMAAAATGLINREILRVQAQTADEHEALGVLNPSTADLDGKIEGVGTRVMMTDVDDKTLVDMIIGNEVKDSPGQYYVRNSNQDVVYVVKLDPEKLVTSFDEWIEDDLLKLDPFNIEQVFINDYSAELSFGITPQGQLMPQVSWDRRGQMRLAYDNSAAKWEPLELVKFNPQTAEPAPRPLGEDEELDEEALRELRNGLDDLLIVDVERKPAGLSADLKAGEDFLKDRESAENLIDRGFAPVRLEEGGPMEILSSEGEIVCTMKNGVEYVLRFGKLAMDAATDAAASEATDATSSKLNRYLFVSARFNEDVVERPELKDVPELPEGVDESAASEETETPEGESEAAADDSADESASGDEAAAEAEPTEEEEEEEEAAEGEGDAGSEAANNEAGSAEPSAESAEPAAKAGEAAADQQTAEGAATAAENAEEDAAAASDSQDDLEALIAERKATQQENDRLLDEYKATLDEGREKVDELNERFGDWYYVISEDVYKQIHLSLDDVIKKKAEEEGEDADGAATPADDDPLTGLPDLPLGSSAQDENEAAAEAAEAADEAADEAAAEQTAE